VRDRDGKPKGPLLDELSAVDDAADNGDAKDIGGDHAPSRHDHYSGDMSQLLDDPPADEELPAVAPPRDNHNGDIDQLLDDPPDTDYHRGRFAGYEAGSRVRRFVFIGLALSSIAAVIAGYWYITYLHANRTPQHAVPLPEGTDTSKRSRTMTWSSGQARLGLTREPPGLLAIELPDRTIRLAPDCDSAQVRLDVVDGKTVQMTVLFGDIVEEPASP